jgi:uncharacterized membrane protein YhaH (DUF805 family)
MGPFKALDSVITQYATFRGRASRSEFWWFALMHFLIMLCAIAGDLYLFDPFAPITLNPFAYFTGFWIIATIIPQLAVTIRRLHDAGYSGLWYFIAFVPLGTLVLLVLTVLPSEAGANIYGPPPFGGGGSTYGSRGLDDPHAVLNAPQRPAKADPYAPYAALERARQPKSADLIAAQKEEINDYFRTRVLKKA